MPPTRTATSEAILIISSDKDSNARNSFTLGWWGSEGHSCEGALPSLQLSLHSNTSTLASEMFILPWTTVQEGPFPPHARWCHKEVEVLVWLTNFTTQQHEETSSAF